MLKLLNKRKRYALCFWDSDGILNLFESREDPGMIHRHTKKKEILVQKG